MADKNVITTPIVENTVAKSIDTLVQNAQKALSEFLTYDQETIDKIVHAMALAGISKHQELARMAVDETGRGVYEDKVIKNMFATEYIWHDIKNEKTVGIIADNDIEDYVEVAEPIGVICGVTPTTNPTSTTLFKALISIKTRNPIIFGFHPSAQKCSAEAARIVYEAAVKAGAPKHCIQWIEKPSIEATGELMKHPGVATILATGGPGMVAAAYSCGKPALGVGPGNVPCFIEKSADIGRACTDLMMSKTFDNGMICASEQAAIVEKPLAKAFESYMKENNCHFCNKEETAKLTNFMFPNNGHAVFAEVVGQSANWIAEKSGFTVPAKTKILLALLPEPSEKYPLSFEKLSPVLAYFIAENKQQGFDYSNKMLELGGLGHSAVIHTNDDDIADAFGIEMKVGRIIANSPSSQGAIGDIYNTSTPSLTLGCGSHGKNSVSQNVTTVNLVNKKRIAKRRENMQWFKIPPKIYFQNDSIQYLEKMEDISRAFIVTDPTMVQLGNVDKILYYLRKRGAYCHSEIYSDVEPDPSVECIMKGVEAMNAFKPDVIIALGGGSAIDAAKGMWLFYEHPETSFDGLRQRFMDIRKRTFKFPKLGSKAKLVAIPTTSGTGSEVTSFTVITDKANGNIKYPLADYSLTPDVAIIDPQFTHSMPKSIIADTGLDVLTHAIESYVSVMANDYTDGLALHAIQLVFSNLEKSYNGDLTARAKMHNASAIAGMAFTNAFLGLNHSMAHKLGGEFHVPHGRANAILLPYVIAYNAQKPTKFASFPRYKEYIADERYAEIARRVALCDNKAPTAEAVQALIKGIQDLMTAVQSPKTIKETGVKESDFMGIVNQMSYNAFEDQCTTANPVYPLVSEIEELYKKAYFGK